VDGSLQGFPSAFRDPEVKHHIPRTDRFGRDANEAAPDEAGKEFEIEAAGDQKMLGAPGRLSRNEFERSALVGHELV
jgi:hypothetical protein